MCRCVNCCGAHASDIQRLQLPVGVFQGPYDQNECAGVRLSLLLWCLSTTLLAMICPISLQDTPWTGCNDPVAQITHEVLQQLGLDKKLDIICDILASGRGQLWNHAARAAACLLPFSSPHAHMVMPALRDELTGALQGMLGQARSTGQCINMLLMPWTEASRRKARLGPSVQMAFQLISLPPSQMAQRECPVLVLLKRKHKGLLMLYLHALPLFCTRCARMSTSRSQHKSPLFRCGAVAGGTSAMKFTLIMSTEHQQNTALSSSGTSCRTSLSSSMFAGELPWLHCTCDDTIDVVALEP
jgi:hypothetical protein